MIADQDMTPEQVTAELLACAASPYYFIVNYCRIYDGQTWIPFDLWFEQIEALNQIHEHQFVIVLKARQLGLSWLGLSYILWQMLFRPIATVLIFSRRDEEASYLLGVERLRGMYKRLPKWLQAEKVVEDNVKTWRLSNGSSARAFAPTSGDSYTATFVMVDEADLIDNLSRLMGSIKPTIDAGGKLFLVSRVNKKLPHSMFKKIYEGAKAGLNEWVGIFLPWWIRPERTAEWYESIKSDILARTDSLDELKEQYPATDREALEPEELNKRIAPAWLTQCYVEAPIIAPPPALEVVMGNSLTVYHPPQVNRQYVIGVDCAEGLPTSDDSVSLVIDDTGVQVAKLSGKITPEDHAAQTKMLSDWYNNAEILTENNNHGWSFIMWFTVQGFGRLIQRGHNNKQGWSSNTLGKSLMYTDIAEAAKERTITIHDTVTLRQLQSIEKHSLRAPPGELDDEADAMSLAVIAYNRLVKLMALRASGSGKIRASGLYSSASRGRGKDRP